MILDIGDEIGALVITIPAALEGREIEILPTGDTPHADPAGWSSADSSATGWSSDDSAGGADHVHADGTTHSQHDDTTHSQHDDTTHSQHDATPHLLHVAVHRRLAAGDAVWSAVFPELHEGTYDLDCAPTVPSASPWSSPGARSPTGRGRTEPGRMAACRSSSRTPCRRPTSTT